MALRPKKLVLPIALAAAVLVLVLLTTGGGSPVEVAAIRRGPVRSAVEEEGRTRVVQRYVLAAPTDGRLLRVTREEGDAVEAGEVVARFDALALESRLAEAEARLAGAGKQLEGVGRKRPKEEEIERSRLEEKAAAEAVEVAKRELAEATATHANARTDADRARALAAEGTINESERDAAVLAETTARERMEAQTRMLRIREIDAEAAKLRTSILEESAHDVDWEEAFYRESVRELRAQLAVVRDDVGRGEIAAPVAGVVLERYVESETPIAAGTPILTVGDLGKLEVEADVLSEDAAHMRPGMPVEIFGRALGDKVVKAKLARIYPSAFRKISSLGVEQQRVTIVAVPDEAVPGLGDRYRVDVRVVLEAREDALLVPEAALFRVEGEWSAFRVEGGRARLVRVGTGLRDGRVREVLSGLTEGDRVILHPDDALEDGAKVEPSGSDAP